MDWFTIAQMEPSLPGVLAVRLWAISDIVRLLEAKEGDLLKQARAERERRATAPMIQARDRR